MSAKRMLLVLSVGACVAALGAVIGVQSGLGGASTDGQFLQGNFQIVFTWAIPQLGPPFPGLCLYTPDVVGSQKRGTAVCTLPPARTMPLPTGDVWTLHSQQVFVEWVLTGDREFRAKGAVIVTDQKGQFVGTYRTETILFLEGSDRVRGTFTNAVFDPTGKPITPPFPGTFEGVRIGK